jgi:hypothetical protein
MGGNNTMDFVTTPADKLDRIAAAFGPLLGKRIIGYEVAELYCSESAAWAPWLGLPLYLVFEGGAVVSICWSKFDDLCVLPGRYQPHSLVGYEVRWVGEGLAVLDDLLGRALQGVWLGAGQMAFGANEVPIWSRLIMELAEGSPIEIFNALDENGFERSKADDRTAWLKGA